MGISELEGIVQKHESHFSSVTTVLHCVLSQCNTWLRLLHLLYDTDFNLQCKGRTKHAFSMFYALIKHGFLTNQSVLRVLSTL